MRRGPIVATLAVLACSGSEQKPGSSESAGKFDSLIAQSDIVTATAMSAAVTDPQKATFIARLGDPADVVSKFLGRLPQASVTGTSTELSDTLFAFLGGPQQRDSLAFVLGSVLADSIALDRLMASTGHALCVKDAECRIKARDLPQATRSREPDLIAIEKPDIERFLSTPLGLPGGETIGEERDVRAVGNQIARSVCIGTKSTIQYAPGADRTVSPITFAFLRAHEYGHFLLRHVRCDGGRPDDPAIPSVRERELSADCRAAAILVRDVSRGENIVNHTAGEFYGLNWPARDYPSTRERHDNLYQPTCG